jgi:hypothetical protein
MKKKKETAKEKRIRLAARKENIEYLIHKSPYYFLIGLATVLFIFFMIIVGTAGRILR